MLAILIGLVSQFSLALSLGYIFNEMCEVTKSAWPSDIAKEKFNTNLKVHCVIKLSLSYKVFRWHPQNNRL